jgi:hypothetical protein
MREISSPCRNSNLGPSIPYLRRCNGRVITAPYLHTLLSLRFILIISLHLLDLGTNLTNQNSIQEEIKSRLKSGNACYHSVQNILSSSLLSKNIQIKIYRITILPVVLYGCETWSLTLREERRLRVFENGVLRRIFGPTRDEVTGDWRKQYNVRVIKSRRMRRAGHVARMGIQGFGGAT